MKKTMLVLLAVFLLVACKKDSPETETGVLKDGEYSAESDPDEWGGKAVVHLTVEDGKITTCTMENLDNQGHEKDEEYGKENGKITNPGLYKIAQNAVENSKKYPEELLATQDMEQVEVISGATVTHDNFKNAVHKILEEAME